MNTNSGSGSGNTLIPTPRADCHASVVMRRQAREHNGSPGDALIDLYVDWREECCAVRAKYERWREAGKDDSAAAFAAYCAALDQEERAGNVYAELVLRVTHTAPRAA